MQAFEIKDISKIAKQVIEKISAAVSVQDGAVVVALSGDLGAGKTTLVQEVAKQFGITETVISPTFTIMKSYQISHTNFNKVIHIDAYRLKSGNELVKLGWADISTDPKNIIFVEWPEQVPELMDDAILKISLSHKDEKTRIIGLKNTQ